MTWVRSLVSAGALMGLTGCAGFLYESVPEQELDHLSDVMFVSEKCRQAGLVDYSTMLQARQYVKSNHPAHQTPKLMGMYEAKRKESRPISEPECSGLASMLATQSYQPRSAPAPAYTPSMPKTTVCNRVYNQTYCTTQ